VSSGQSGERCPPRAVGRASPVPVAAVSVERRRRREAAFVAAVGWVPRWRRRRRRSDLALKPDVVLLCRLDNGLGFYRFSYLGSDKLMSASLRRRCRPYCRRRGARAAMAISAFVTSRLGVKFQTYKDWLDGGAQYPYEIEELNMTAFRSTRYVRLLAAWLQSRV